VNELTPFEKEIKQTYRLPDANPAFFNRLEVSLQAYQPGSKAKPIFHFAGGGVAHKWGYAMAALLLIGIMVLAIGPSKVLAQIQAVFGFVPGVGIVDTNSPFRQLDEPVSDTRDGITLTIRSAFLSADQTTITYAMSDLPVDIKRKTQPIRRSGVYDDSLFSPPGWQQSGSIWKQRRYRAGRVIRPRDPFRRLVPGGLQSGCPGLPLPGRYSAG
jgi:hypothetical protein